MASTLSPSPVAPPAQDAPTHRGFQVALLLASLWTVGGAYLDGWAHHFRPGLETFFTPWHAVLYSGFTAAGALLAGAALLSWRRTGSWRAGMAPGAVGSLAGAVLFAVGGVGDMLWHLAFGVEADLEALLSPTHLVLVIGLSLIVTGPLRGAWGSGHRLLPWTAALSAGLFLAAVSFITVYAQPLAHPHASATGIGDLLHETGPTLGVTSVLWNAALVTGLLLLLARRFVLPVGAASLILGLHIVLLGLMEGRVWLMPVALLAGPAVDLLLHRLGRGSGDGTGTARWRALGVGIPVVLYAAYFLVVAVADGIGWSVHLWTGSVVLAGLTGLLVSYVAAPPAAQRRADSAAP